MRTLLQSVLLQISIDPSTITSSDLHSDDLEILRAALRRQIDPSRRLFLVVDDLDLCNLKVTALIEEELVKFQQDLNFGVMVTSRLPHRYDNLENRCDIMPDDEWHSNEIIPIYWRCSTCEKSTFEPLVICQSCANDYTCETW